MPERAAVFLTELQGSGKPGPPASGRLMPVGNFVGEAFMPPGAHAATARFTGGMNPSHTQK